MRSFMVSCVRMCLILSRFAVQMTPPPPCSCPQSCQAGDSSSTILFNTWLTDKLYGKLCHLSPPQSLFYLHSLDSMGMCACVHTCGRYCCQWCSIFLYLSCRCWCSDCIWISIHAKLMVRSKSVEMAAAEQFSLFRHDVFLSKLECCKW